MTASNLHLTPLLSKPNCTPNRYSGLPFLSYDDNQSTVFSSFLRTYLESCILVLISFNDIVTAFSILISVARLIFLFTLFDIGWEIWLRQTLETNKMGTSFSNMKSLRTTLYFWLFMKVLARLWSLRGRIMWRKFAEIKVEKILDPLIILICACMTLFCGFTFGWPFNYSIPSTNDK